MKLVLILMVKNESKILERCLKAVEDLVDAFCISDTGSTDNTREIAKDFLSTRKGCVSITEWQNFGYNRTASFVAARDYLRDKLEWDLKECYGLLLDADMVFVPGKLREQNLTEIGYTIIQAAGTLEYPNCRLIRMDYGWNCLGVTHEYWDGPTVPLSKDICYIDDKNDGGCKSDKFERDARLLEKGLEDDPKNVRYMFYLAQTYNSLGRWEDCIKMYKKRIAAGGWFEEVWYSHYMIGQTYLILNDPIKFEEWMLKATKLHPGRAEPYYKLARYFREKSEHYKAYYYVLKGKAIPESNDSLFVEKSVYRGLFDYEATILMYYLKMPKIEGLRESMYYLMNKTENLQNVYQNMGFYIEPVSKTVQSHPVLHDAWGHDYHPTSICVFDYKGRQFHNVRFVNYVINQNTGSYMMKDGYYSENHKVRTQNLLWCPTFHQKMKDDTVGLPRLDKHIVGLEDVRVYTNKSGELCFTATTVEYSEKIRILHGKYNIETFSYSDCKVLESPTNAGCEKNWIPVNNTDDVIYRWHPLEIGVIQGNELKIHTKHTTPWFFQHLRGSAIPLRVVDELWCLVHFVEYSTPRKYFHCFVSLDANTYKPKAISLPFVFRSNTIEYCIGCSLNDKKNIECIFSTMDDNPCITEFSPSQIEWLRI